MHRKRAAFHSSTSSSSDSDDEQRFERRKSRSMAMARQRYIIVIIGGNLMESYRFILRILSLSLAGCVNVMCIICDFRLLILSLFCP